MQSEAAQNSGGSTRKSTGASYTIRDPAIVALLNEGLSRQRGGDLDKAEGAYNEALAKDPENPHVLHLLGVIHHQRGDHAKAIDLIEQAIERLPDLADAYINLGAAYLGARKPGIAATRFRRATELDPNSAEAYSNLAYALNELGSRNEAIEAYRQAAHLAPTEPRFLKRLGDICVEYDRFSDAAKQFEAYLRLRPDDAEVENNLGYAFEHLGEIAEAEQHYRRAADIKPDSPDILKNLAGVLMSQGNVEEGQAVYDKVLNASPEQWADMANLAALYVSRRDVKRALSIYEQLVEVKSDDAKMLSDYGVALTVDRQYEAANDQFHKALVVNPSFAEAYANLGNNKLLMGDRAGGVESLKQALKYAPRMLVAHINMCLALMHERRIDEAYMIAKATTMLEDYGPAHFTNPHKVFRGVCDFDGIEELGDAWENIERGSISQQAANFLEMLVVTETEEQIGKLSRLHLEWGHHITKGAADQRLPDPQPKRGHDKIRLGFLSSDLKSHSVAKFVRPVLDYYDRDRFEVFCYTPKDVPGDPVRKAIAEQVDSFQSVENLSDNQIARRIRDDEIDILLELNGFTLDSRVGVLAHRPAPVQIYWLGYPFTTGLEDADYVLLDKYFAPENPDWLAETPLLMPDSWVTLMDYPDEPISEQPPFERNDGGVTFGTFNNPYKYTRETIAAWARVMLGTPGSRFLFVRPEVTSMVLCANLVKEFESHGIERDRLFFVNNRATNLSYLSFYDEIDITLDTFPLTGGTTTFDALWMGVPVITRVGPNMHQRLSYSILENLGAGELCAHSEEDFVNLGIALANDPQSMREYRHGIRDAMRSSPLSDGKTFTRNMETVLEEVARKHGIL